MPLIYIKSFEPKQDLSVVPISGRVFVAEQTKDEYVIKFDHPESGEVMLSLKDGLTDNGNFSCHSVVITKQNYKSLKINKEDKKLVEEMFIEDKIMKATDKAQKEFEKQVDNAFEEIGKLAENDVFLLLAIAKVASHINTTYSDKYNTENPEVELNGLMRHSPHGKGFNIGNASKYIRRYFTEGFPKSNDPTDILKAVHYQLMELDRRSNEV